MLLASTQLYDTTSKTKTEVIISLRSLHFQTIRVVGFRFITVTDNNTHLHLHT